MRYLEITENYFSQLQTDAQNLLLSLIGKQTYEINTNDFVDELKTMGHSVTPNSLGDLVKNMKLVRSVNPEKITLQKNHNLTQYSKDATMDNNKKVAAMAKKTIDRDIV
jgi:hypothetical protein